MIRTKKARGELIRQFSEFSEKTIAINKMLRMAQIHYRDIIPLLETELENERKRLSREALIKIAMLDTYGTVDPQEIHDMQMKKRRKWFYFF